MVVIVMMLIVLPSVRPGPSLSSSSTHPSEVPVLHARIYNSRMTDVYPSLAVRFNPFWSLHCVNTMTHFFCSPSANSAVWWRRVGPLLISHRAVASSRAQVQPAGRRGDEVSNAAGRPLHGGGKSGPYSASREAGVCMQSSVKPIGVTLTRCYVSA